MASLRTLDCQDADAARWDAFVAERPQARFFHAWGWRAVLSESLGHDTHYLLAERDGDVVGVLPMVHVRSFLFGNTLSSLAFCSDAGPLATDEEASAALYAAASERGRRLGVGSIEYRLTAASGRDVESKDLYETFAKPIDPDPDANMKAIRSKQRNVIRKGIKNGLSSRVGEVGEFYDVYSESVRNLGTPVFPRRLFEAIASTFPDNVEVLMAELDGRPISGAMNFYFRDSVCPYYWGGTWEARNLKGNDFLAWEIMCRAAERGCTEFDFGRSKKGTGSRKWKENLGFEPQPLFYEYELIRDAEMPDLNPTNPKYRFFVEAWKRLPLPVAGVIGPRISRYLG